MTCFASTAVVTAPTPAGTGVMALTTGSTSAKFTSPHNLPLSSKLIPTSIIICPAATKFLAMKANRNGHYSEFYINYLKF